MISLWEKANISDTSARKMLIEGVVFGLLDLNAEGKNQAAAEMALTALEGPGKPVPRGVKKTLSAKVKTAVAASDDLRGRATKAGFSVPKKNRLGRA